METFTLSTAELDGLMDQIQDLQSQVDFPSRPTRLDLDVFEGQDTMVIARPQWVTFVMMVAANHIGGDFDFSPALGIGSVPMARIPLATPETMILQEEIQARYGRSGVIVEVYVAAAGAPESREVEMWGRSMSQVHPVCGMSLGVRTVAIFPGGVDSDQMWTSMLGWGANDPVSGTLRDLEGLFHSHSLGAYIAPLHPVRSSGSEARIHRNRRTGSLTSDGGSSTQSQASLARSIMDYCVT
jgi:hypothetical protein